MSYPGSSQFFNDTRRKTGEPGKIHYMHDVKDVWDLVWRAHTHSFLGLSLGEDDGKTAGSSKLESPGKGMLTQVKTTTNVSVLYIATF